MERYSDLQLKDKTIAQEGVLAGHYEYCEFLRCDFSGFDLRGFSFTECYFIECDLSNANVAGSGFREVNFVESKLMGVDFEHCDAFGLGFSFETCNLNFANFSRLKLKKVKFNNCKMVQSDFTNADLSDTQLNECDLTGAIFFQCNIEGVDMSTSVHFSFDPCHNKFKGMKISAEALMDLAKRMDIVVTG